MEKNIDITLNELNIVVDEAIDCINIKTDEINKWQKIYKEIFGENCEEEIFLPTINHSNDEYKDIEMKQLKKYVENIYQTKDGMEILIKYIEKLEQILENCKQNIFTKIKSIKTNCVELIITIQSTISKISSEIIKKEKKEILSSISNKLNFYKDDVVLEYENSLDIYKNLKKIYDDLELFNIEQFGKVKVYVKLRPKKEDGGYGKLPGNEDNEIIEIGNKDDENDDEKKIKIKCIGKEKIYGPFKDICFGSNKDLFNMIKDNFTWEQIKNKTTILFSYGISGSGKSYTMFNHEKDEGIFFLIFKHNFEEIGSTFSISVESIFEHKFSDSNFINVNGVNVNFNPTNLKGERKDLIKVVGKDIYETIKNITQIRKDAKTIKHTPNNTESSRSHLFIVLKILKKETGESGHIVLCDSAGRESPIEIAKSYYSDKATPSQIFQGGNVSTHAAYQNIIISKIPPDLLKECNTENCVKYKNKNKNLVDFEIGEIGKIDKKDFKNIKDISKYIQDIVKEGFFINESLNHIVKYLDRNIKRGNICEEKKGKENTSVENYNLHEDSLDTVYTFLEPPDKNPNDDPIGIYKIFNELKGLSGGKYRFIMIANSRTEEDKCNSIQSTFDFVDKIKST